jgi:signal transduction histidine kinase
VTDNGGGMTQEQLRHIFEPFYTTKAGGTGLGLPTCLRIMEQHGGSIEVRSVPGKGSVVTMNFPAAKPQKAAVSAAA